MPPVAGIASALGTAGSVASSVGSIGNAVGGLFGGGGPSPAEIRKKMYEQQLANANQAQEQFLTETNKPTEGLDTLQKDITAGMTPAQVNQLKSTNLALKKVGVRGGQAATIAGRQTAQTAQDIQENLNKTMYEDALKRKQAKQSYLGGKASQMFSALPA